MEIFIAEYASDPSSYKENMIALPQVLVHFIPIYFVPPIRQVAPVLRARSAPQRQFSLSRAVYTGRVMASPRPFHHQCHAILPHDMTEGASAVLMNLN